MRDPKFSCRFHPSVNIKFVLGSITAAGLVFLFFLIFSASSPEISYCPHRRPDEAKMIYFNDIDMLLIHKTPYDFLNPPFLAAAYLDPKNETNALELQTLSEIVQAQIPNIQDSSNCGKNAILCGHTDSKCGFGCHIHHRVACLMLSYAMGLPLIHETEIDGGKWAFSTPWSEVMLPLGSSCNTSSSTYAWTWYHKKGFYSQPQNNLQFSWNPDDSKQPDKLGFPLFDGIVAASPLAEMVERLHPDPFLWWISQFVQHVMRVQPETTQRIKDAQASIGLRPNCIGLHVRRTDKKREANDSYHELDEYFTKAKEVEDGHFRKMGIKPQIYIASDDATILSNSRKKYKEWDIVGFSDNHTLKNPKERQNFLFEIVRDTITLSQCDTVICGLSSNVCRLILEMQVGSERELISLERSYYYAVRGVYFKPKINKVSFRVIRQIDGKEYL